MPFAWFVPMLVGFVGLVLFKVAWRASLTLFVALAVHFIGLLGAVFPPVVVLNQVIGHALVGAALGTIVCTGPERSEVRRLPVLASVALLILTASWVGSLNDLVAGLWLFAVRSVVLPLTMFAVIALAQRHIAAKLASQREQTERKSPQS